MAERSIVVRLKAEVSDLKRKLAEGADAAQKAGKRIGDAITENSDSINTLANGAGVLGGAMVAAAGVAIKRFADFDAAMSNVQAATMESAANMDLLRDAALEAGQRTAYSATEAAAGIEELAKAGVSTADILSGGLDGALDLAAAGGIGVAEAAETAASAMTQFGLEGQDVTRIADVLAAGASKAQGGVSDLGNALKFAGIPAAQMGITLEETAGTLALFASNGIIGEQAGTSFRSMLMSLTAPTKVAQQEMEKYGISLFDTQGKFVGMEAAAGILQSRLGDLSDAERAAALGRIVGNEAIGATNALMVAGAEGVRDWTSAVDEQGFAADQAAMRLDNLKGDVEELGGALETAFINAGEGGNDALRSLVQGATELINKFSELPDEAQTATLAIVGSGGFALLALAGLGRVVTAVNDVRLAFQKMGASAKVASVSVGLVGAALTAGVFALMEWAAGAAEARARTEEFQDTLDATGNTTEETIERINSSLSSPIGGGDFLDFFGQTDQMKSAIELAEEFGFTIQDLQDYILGAGDAQERLGRALKETQDQALADEAADLLRYLEQQSSALTDAERAQARKAEADREAGLQQEVLQEQYDATVAAVEAQENALRDLISAQAEAAGIVASVMEAQAGFEQALDDATAAIEKNGATLDLNTQAGRDNQAALLDIKDAGYELLASMEANGAEQGELTSAMQRTRDEFVKAAEQMDMTSEEANALADELGLIPENVTVTANLKDNITGAIEGVMYSLSRLPDSRTVTLNKVTNEITVSSGKGNMVARAEGGIVYGPGTSTSDSIPARLSNGEYVIKADSVQRYGKSFFDSLNAQRFATGGYVGAAPAAASGPAMGDLAGALDGMTFTLVTEAGPIRAIARAEAVSTVRSAAAGRR